MAKAAFRLGQAEGRWRLISVAWPFSFFGVVAKDDREYVLRLNCAGYPQAAPTGGPWDRRNNQVLASICGRRAKAGVSRAVFPPRLEEWKRSLPAL